MFCEHNDLKVLLCLIVLIVDFVDLLQDDKLKQVVQQTGPYDWKQVSAYFPDRTDIQCQHRWYKVLNPDLIKGAWTKEVCTAEKLYWFHNKISLGSRMQCDLQVILNVKIVHLQQRLLCQKIKQHCF